MPSDSKKKREQKKKEAAKNKGKKSATNGATNGTTNGATNDEGVNGITQILDELQLAAKHRSVTGVLTSHADARDLHIHNMTITFHGAELLVDCDLELNNGRRYGLIGLNGCGKSTLLAALAMRELPVPDHIDIFMLRREMAPSDKTALQCVMEVDEERIKLEHEAEVLATKDDQESHDRLMDLYERLDDMDADKAETNAAYILTGLGFTKKMQGTAVKHFSGGWRMRIALARALFIKPALLLLDEPTNHLDLNACVWLEEELAQYKRILVVISHSQDFMNGVCTNILHMNKQKIKVFGGNYDSYVQTRFELEENQMKKYKWEQDQISNMKNYIARFGHGSAKLARQAQSKEKTLKKMVDGGLTERVASDKMGLLPGPWKTCGVILGALFVAYPANSSHPAEHGDASSYAEKLKKQLHKLNLDNLYDKDHGIKMGVSTKFCDDGQTKISVDWNPKSTKEMECTDTEDSELDLVGDVINITEATNQPSEHICFPNKIKYKDDFPLSGSHRPLWPQFGEYKYLPPQRWVHSLEHGAIVLLYHPCVADVAFTQELKTLVGSCLWKHVISPYRKILYNKPYALVSYGHALLFGKSSQWDQGTLEDMVKLFIKTTAHKASETPVTDDGQYFEGIKTHAKNKNRPNEVVC